MVYDVHEADIAAGVREFLCDRESLLGRAARPPVGEVDDGEGKSRRRGGTGLGCDGRVLLKAHFRLDWNIQPCFGGISFLRDI